jgi:LacI family gluconate utilization system Gnt-I transcriptional repressor
MKRVKLSQVAELAGVSEITASRALRNGANVAPQTQKKVAEAAQQLGYLPNRIAGSLAGAASNQIGVIVPSLTNNVFPQVLQGLESRLTAAGYHTILGVSDYLPEREEVMIRTILAWRPAALVIGTASLTDTSRKMLEQADVPIVEIMDCDIEPIDMAAGISQVQAGKALGYYLTGRGYERLAYIGHDLEADRRAGKRREGFLAAARETGASITAELTAPAPSSVALGRELTARLLAEAPERPQAICYSNDDMAVGGFFHCMAAGLDVPGDLAICGFNGLDIGQQLPCPLTTIESGRTGIGEQAAAMILSRFHGSPTPTRLDTGFRLLRGASA